MGTPRSRLIDFLTPPESNDLITAHRVRFLHHTLILSFFGGTVISLINLAMGAVAASLVILAVPVYTLLGLWLNRRGRYNLAAAMLVVVSYIVLVYNLFDGAGLHDPATAGLLVWVILVALLFERIWIVVGCLVGIGSLASVMIAQELGLFTPGYTATYFRLYTLSTVYILGSVSMYIFAGSWRRTIDSLQESYDRTLKGWVKALEYKDPATSGHVQEVVELTTRLAENMGCSAEEIQHIRRGALLHDIGKLGIPDRILAKSGPLSDDEWKIMREHPSLAREFLSGIPFLAAAINIPYSHHEQWNGDGYPQGLRGDEIPLAARIFAVVDVWHALNEDRPYRPAWTRPEIVAYLRSNAGTLFDPDVVRCFLEIVE